MPVLGIDPGLDGFLVALQDDGSDGQAWPMPVLGSGGAKRVLDGPGLANVIVLLNATTEGIDYCLIEEVMSGRFQSAQATLKTGKNYGRILGILDALKIRHETVKPNAWKREIGLPSRGAATSGKAKGERKRDAIELAQRLFPDVDLRKSEKHSVKHDGKAEALLIAELARRRWNKWRGL